MSIPILGQQAAADDVTKGVDILDSEVLEIERVLNIIKARSQGRRNYDAFDREIKERFHDIGFVVSVKWYTAAGPDGIELADVKIPEVQIDARVDQKQFDRDQMSHEVTNDILNLGQKGVISTKGKDFAEMMRAEEAKHKH